MEAGRARKILYRGLGCVAVALGFIGVFVPGMPTTVFVLAASYCFARSSPSMERWLHEHRWFGPSLRRFKETGGMTRPVKTAALGSMWAAASLSAVALAAASRTAALAVVALAAAGTAAILFAVRTVPEDVN